MSAAMLRAATLVLLASSLAVLIRLSLRIPSLAPLDPNEGWNAYHASALLSGGALYPAASSLFFNNYPPLSFHAVAWLCALAGDPISAGRMLSILSLVWLALATAMGARGLGASREHAVFAGAFLLAVFLAYSHYPGMSDPQLFGHAIGATGLALILRRPQSRLAAAGAAVCCAGAFFVKHNLVALPLALLAWLALFHARSLAAFAIASAGALACLLVAAIAAYGTGFPAYLLSPRTYSLTELWTGSTKWLSKSAWFFVPPCWLLLRARADAALAWCAIYGALSLATGLYFIGGVGVDQNAFFDAYIAAALSCSVVLERVQRRTVLAWYVVPLAAAIALQSERAWLQTHWWTAPVRDASREFAASVAFVSGRGGKAACMEQSLCFRAGMPAAVDFFNFYQHVGRGLRDEGELLRRIDAGEFATVQLALAADPASALGIALSSGYTPARRDAWGVYYIRR